MNVLFVTRQLWSEQREKEAVELLSSAIGQDCRSFLLFAAYADAIEERNGNVIVKAQDLDFWVEQIVRTNRPEVVLASEADAEWIARLTFLPIATDPEGVLASLPVASAEVEKQEVRVLIVSSWDIKCGIAEYAKLLVDHLKKRVLEVSVLPFSSMSAYDAPILDRFPRPDIVHYQYDVSFVSSEELFLKGVKGIRQIAPAIGLVLTAHYYDDGVYHSVGEVMDRVIVHRPWGTLPGNALHMVQGCPVAPLLNKQTLRELFKIPVDARVLASFGFALRWKNISQYLFSLFPYFQKHPLLYGQFLHAAHESEPEYATELQEEIVSRAERMDIADRVFFCPDFLPKDEINARLQTANVGLVFGDSASAGSSSAALKGLVTARIPIVATNITHYRDLPGGVWHAPVDPGGFAAEAARLIHDEGRLAQLSIEQLRNYENMNFDAFAKRHVDLYNQVLAEKRGGGV